MCLDYSSKLVGALIGLLAATTADFSAADSSSLKQIANVSFAAEESIGTGSASMFSPRMDFEQWRPLTGRGDPLRNDPTYDYEPPVLERVHYWAEETRLEREHYPERKSEVLMLGISSRKPSIGSRQPALPSRRPHRPSPPKYEEFQYKLSDHYPMTILVPPPPPPPGHKPPLFVLDDKLPIQTPHPKPTDPQYDTKETTTDTPEHLTSLYALQESNLIYQSSTTNQNWIINSNHTKSNYSSVSSDYAGWGPTTPLDENDVNDTLNFILNDHFDLSKQPYAFYKPMLSEAPPPPHMTLKPLLPSFVPTALPLTQKVPLPLSTFTEAANTWTDPESFTETPAYYEDTTTDKRTTFFQPTPASIPRPSAEKTSIFDMLGSMISMPLVNGPDRPEDNLYAHASNNIQVFKEKLTGDPAKLETMQTMQPPPPSTKTTESSPVSDKPLSHVNPFVSIGNIHRKPTITHDPYLHMRYTTPSSTSTAEATDQRKSTTEIPSIPMYLIIQGHSKVKTYGSKPKPDNHNDDKINEIPKLNETKEVKHLHPIKEKVKHEKPSAYRTSRTQNLKSLVDNGFGSIEIQEANVGIKYDVSDGSDVPVEIYRKGIVDSDVDIDNYKNNKGTRTKRQVDLEDLIHFDEDTIEEYVFDFLKGRRKDTGITGLIAQAVTSDAAAGVVDDLDDDSDEDDDDEHRFRLTTRVQKAICEVQVLAEPWTRPCWALPKRPADARAPLTHTLLTILFVEIDNSDKVKAAKDNPALIETLRGRLEHFQQSRQYQLAFIRAYTKKAQKYML